MKAIFHTRKDIMGGGQGEGKTLNFVKFIKLQILSYEFCMYYFIIDNTKI